MIYITDLRIPIMHQTLLPTHTHTHNNYSSSFNPLPCFPFEGSILNRNEMLRKKMFSIGKLGRKAKPMNAAYGHSSSSTREALLEAESKSSKDMPSDSSVLSCSRSPSYKGTPSGFFAIYVGKEKERFVVPTSFLSHPLFKILLEKAYDEFGFEQMNGLVLPCTVSTFQEVVDAVEGCHGRFDVGKLLEEFD